MRLYIVVKIHSLALVHLCAPAGTLEIRELELEMEEARSGAARFTRWRSCIFMLPRGRCQFATDCCAITRLFQYRSARDTEVGIRNGGSEKRGVKIHSLALVHLCAPAGTLEIRELELEMEEARSGAARFTR